MSDHLIDNKWLTGRGATFSSVDPSSGGVVCTIRAADSGEVDRAVLAARRAFEPWADLSVEERAAYLHGFGLRIEEQREDLARAISREMGKPLWESRAEVSLMIAKIDVSIDAYALRRKSETRVVGGASGVTRFRPHGVAAVFGPFNLPGHLPNGHIVPALLAGNTVVFKPSEMTPLAARLTAEAWVAAGLPRGVVNLVQGARETGQALVDHRGVDAVFFTGSFAAGRAISRALADEPGKIVALEMGGNNPLITWGVEDVDAAAYTIAVSAFITSGQRCTCARRLIVPADAEGDRVIESLVKWMSRLRVGKWDAEPAPFLGPVVSAAAAERLMAAQRSLIDGGGRAIVPMTQSPDCAALLTPGLIDVTAVRDTSDEEWFGPLLQVSRVPDFDAAIACANRTSFGLAAGLICDDGEKYHLFQRRVRAGVMNWNQQLTGASGQLPFGGVGRSGNHRPSGFYAADYCSYPVASLESARVAMPEKTIPGIVP